MKEIPREWNASYNLKAIFLLLEQRFVGDQELLRLVSEAEECRRILAACSEVPAATIDDIEPRVARYRAMSLPQAPDAVDPYAGITEKAVIDALKLADKVLALAYLVVNHPEPSVAKIYEQARSIKAYVQHNKRATPKMVATLAHMLKSLESQCA